jgi:hypothetical protein
MSENIMGVVTGTTVSEFLANIIKHDENQTLMVKAKLDSTGLSNEAVINNEDYLYVMSADSSNVSQYTIGVSDDGLNSDAVLTSVVYTVTIENQPGEEAGTGSITGFEYGTRLQTVLSNITVPMGASMDVIDGEGAYIPLKMLNFDTLFVDVTVNSDTHLEVVAEDGITKILYQLLPSSTEQDAFVLSDVYSVNQGENLIGLVPRGTYVQTLLSNLSPATGATMMVVNKLGQEIMDGALYEDDKVVVKSADGLVTRVYHLSMLRTQFIQVSPLAYILSNEYSVNQINYVVSGLPESVTISDFHSNITPATGATAVVVDASGNEKATGNVSEDDMVKVTSADGSMIVMYDIDFATSVNKFAEGRIQVYPNPTSGIVNIQGIEQGTRIQLYNQVGALLRDIKSSSTHEILSLNSRSSGMYFIVLTKNSRLIGQYKIIQK